MFCLHWYTANSNWLAVSCQENGLNRSINFTHRIDSTGIIVKAQFVTETCKCLDLTTEQSVGPSIKCSLLGHVRVFVTPWTAAHWPLCPGDSQGKNTGVDCLSLLQGIFPTQGLNPDLTHGRQILYQLTHQGCLYPLTILTGHRDLLLKPYQKGR